MLIVAFDTATDVATTALVWDGERRAELASRPVSVLENIDALRLILIRLQVPGAVRILGVLRADRALIIRIPISILSLRLRIILAIRGGLFAGLGVDVGNAETRPLVREQ
jgi:hypothetical protein